MISKPSNLGLPTDNLEGYTIVFNPPTLTIGVQLWLWKENCPWGRVFIRAYPSQQYVAVGEPEEGRSDVSLICCDGPYFFFIRSIGVKSPTGRGFATEYIVRVGLPQGRCEFFEANGIVGPRGFVSDLHGASPDGNTLFAKVCDVAESGEHTYHMAKIDLVTGSVQLLMALPAVFV